MPGTITFQPRQADLTKEKTMMGTLDPYCKIILGDQKVKGSVCKKGGATPIWIDSISVERGNESVCLLEVKDKEKLLDKTIGSVQIDLDEIALHKNLSRWYDLTHNQEIVGQIFIESSFRLDNNEQIKPEK